MLRILFFMALVIAVVFLFRTWREETRRPQITEKKPSAWKIPPPVLVILLVCIMVVLRLLDAGNLERIGIIEIILGVGSILGGIALSGLAAMRFIREQLNIWPHLPPTDLVTSGLYRYTRNPMYLGMALGLIGIALLLNSIGVWIGPVVFIIAANFLYIPFEEEMAERKFGERFRDYKRHVRRWF